MNNPLTEGKRLKVGFDYFSTGFSPVQIADAYYHLTVNKQKERLLFETATMAEIDEVYNPESENEDRLVTDEAMVLEAIRVQHFARTDTKMAALARVLNSYLKDKGIEAQTPVIGRPKKTGLFATVTVQIPLSDGQVVSIVFHSPENNKMKITADDEIIAFRWLLNKRDITHVVSPEGDADVSLQEVGKRTAQLVEKNSARFQATQKELIEQRKALEDVKAQAEEVTKHHDELMASLKENQDADETADTKIQNLNDRIAKQKEFNDDLQAKIDALKAKKAGNDGKAMGGGTPANDKEMAAEQEQKAFDDAVSSFTSELKAMGFVESEPKTFLLDVIDTTIRKGLSMRTRISANYYVDSETGKIIVNAVKKRFSSLLKNSSGAFTKALKVLADEKAKYRTVMDWLTQYGDIAPKFTVGQKWGLIKFEHRPEDGMFQDPAVVVKITDSVSGSFLPGVIFQICETTQIDLDYEQLTKYLANEWIQAWDEKIAATGNPKVLVVENLPDGWKMTSQDDNTIEYSDGSTFKVRVTTMGEDQTRYQPTLYDGQQVISVESVATNEEANFLAVEMMKRKESLKAEYLNAIHAPTPEDANQTATQAAVRVLNDILAGKCDGDTVEMSNLLDDAAADLEKAGKAAEYDLLLNQVADYLTDTLKKEAA